MKSISSARGSRYLAPDPEGRAPVNRTVLYIEDYEGAVRLVERLLEARRPDTELHVAMNAGEGIKSATDKQPALILLDNHLPDATGIEVLNRLAASETTAGILVVVFSGDSANIGKELLAAGASEFLSKPFDIHQLLAIIDRCIPLTTPRPAFWLERLVLVIPSSRLAMGKDSINGGSCGLVTAEARAGTERITCIHFDVRSSLRRTDR